MSKFVLSALAACGLAVSSALAVPTTIIDTTTGSATADGTIGGSEYVGSSAGVNSGFGGVIGNGQTIGIDSSDTGLLNFGFNLGNTWNNAIVIFIDSVSGGFADTSGFTDSDDGLRRAISGIDGGGQRSTLTFASGFEADYAIAMNTGFAGIWQLANGTFHTYLTNAVFANPLVSSPEIELELSVIGVAQGASFDYVVTYISETGFRSDEFHGVAATTVTTGNPGWTDVVLEDGDFNTFTTIPEPGTIVLGLLGFGLLLIRRFRRE